MSQWDTERSTLESTTSNGTSASMISNAKGRTESWTASLRTILIMAQGVLSCIAAGTHV